MHPDTPAPSFLALTLPVSPRALARSALFVAPLILLSACGGGGNDNGGVFVSTMGATTVAYSRPMTITVTGTQLDRGIRVAVDSGCGEVIESTGGDALTRRYTCKVTATGTLTIRTFNTEGRELARLQATVPQPQVTMFLQGLGTTQSMIVMQLDPARAPLSVNNFLDYTNNGFYRNTIFHRVVKDFVVQAGGYTAGPILKTPSSSAIKLESNNGLKNLRYTVAMARTPVPDSATSQFYINTVDNPSLDYKSEAEPGYAVFGTVISGLEVIDQLNAVATRVDLGSGLTHLPVTNVVISSALQTQ